MGTMMSDMSHLAVVITGASSGVGRATAHAFARRGARLALTARAAGPLEEAAHECEEFGGRAIVVPADVTDPSAMRQLADAAAREFGGLDVWVNNAGLGVVSRFHEVPIEAHRRTVETNLLGRERHDMHSLADRLWRSRGGKRWPSYRGRTRTAALGPPT